MMDRAYEKRSGYAPRNVVNAGNARTERAQFYPMKNAGESTERARSANEQVLRKLLKEAFCGLDTCSLLCLHKEDVRQSERRQSSFLSTLERICEEERVSVFTSLRVWQELHELEERGDDVMKYFARRAINFISRMNGKNLMLVSECRSTVQVNADQELFMICSEEYLRNHVCIFTQDKALAEALTRQNENRMVPHYDVLVRRVNMRGCVTEFDLDGAASSQRAQSEPQIRVVRDLHAAQEPVRRRPEFVPGGAQNAERRAFAQTDAPKPRLQGLRVRLDASGWTFDD